MLRSENLNFKRYFPQRKPAADPVLQLQTVPVQTDPPTDRTLLDEQFDNQNEWTTVSHGKTNKTESIQRENIGTFSHNQHWQPLSEDRQFLQEDVNADLHERFGRPNFMAPPDHFTAAPPPPQQSIRYNNQIREYVDAASQPVNTDSWLSRSEIPTAAEILDIPEEAYGGTGGGGGIAPGEPEVIDLDINNISGPWQSKEKYLSAHYELLREDAIRPLREAVAWVKANPFAKEDEFGGSVGLYERVQMTGIFFAFRGIAVRVVFSLARTGKKVHWEQSKRLISGSLVALTTADDMFQTRCIVAVVAARPLAGLQSNPPEIDLFFADSDDLELDVQREWVMVEERAGFFEAERHTLLALQKLMREPFPLSEHLVDVQCRIEPPRYLQEKPHTDLSCIFTASETETYQNIDILGNWPAHPPTELDKSQLRALRRILTKRLAIIQGPPGTGKTHVSVVALKALLSNMVAGDPPIIVTCQTNHALDQLLRHVAAFEPEFIRLGGRSKDQDVIKKRTLYEVRMMTPTPPVNGGLKRTAIKRMRDLTKSMSLMLSPLEKSNNPLDPTLLQKLGILTQAQCDSLARGDMEYVHHGDPDKERLPIISWLGNKLDIARQNYRPDDFGFEYEEADLEFEQLKELEAENFAQDDEDFESLRGEYVSLADNFIGKDMPGASESYIRGLLEQQDLWKIKPKYRGSIYNYLLRETKRKIVNAFRPHADRYNQLASQRKVGGWEQDAMLLKKQKVIGMTTTGFSKYRALIASLNPKVVLIEEAAETLEAPVIAACVASLEHLILVGDHQQLRPHCHVSDLEGEPYNLNVSLFERMVKNEVEFDVLRRQRRMIPEIRRVLKPIYGDTITDHPSVKDEEVRPPVPGMGGVNSFFFTHDWPETRDEQMSSCNQREAEMIVGFFDYLVYNGMHEDNITILTFYNGQRKAILRMLRSHPNLVGRIFKVVTVDSYQGEENDIVLLSLVRSNDQGKIGFLSIDNRVCVALSRARCGFYLFGNGQLLCSESKTWAGVVTIMAGKAGNIPKSGPKVRIGYWLPLMCKNHGVEGKVWVQEPEDWALINGGCKRKCRDTLSCGHPCKLRCHPFPHEAINCVEKCQRPQPCGHPCAAQCCEPCRCASCGKRPERLMLPSYETFPRLHNRLAERSPERSSSSDPRSWHDFANGGVVEHDAANERKFAAVRQETSRVCVAKGSKIAISNSLDNSSGSGTLPNVLTPPSGSGSDDCLTHTATAYDGKGKARHVWKGTFRSDQPTPEPIRDQEAKLLDGTLDDNLLEFD